MRRRGLIGLGCQIVMAGAAWAQGHEFGYSGESGPENWGRLRPEWQACSIGVNQSPVDLDHLIEAELPALGIRYTASGHEVVNNGHAIQVNANPGSTLEVDDKTFHLQQFHFHVPSEHRLEGRSFPLEAHLVHADAQGALMVLGVLFEVGAPNDVLDTILTSLPSGVGQKRALDRPIAAAGLLPSNRDYLRYNGSLTTPPCSEAVRWLIMKNRVTASQVQIDRIGAAIGFANNRPLQPVNARQLLR